MRDMLSMNVDQIRDGLVVVAEQDSTLLGYYQLGGEPPDGELMDMFIEPAVIGTGLGRMLWEHAVKSASERGFHSLTLDLVVRSPYDPKGRSTQCRSARSATGSPTRRRSLITSTTERAGP